jgi:hypothetical protein
VIGVEQDGISTATLAVNNVTGPVAPHTGSFTLTPALVEGENTVTLTVHDKLGHQASATTKVYLDTVAPTIAISAPANNASFNTARVNVTGTFTEASLKRITVNGVVAFITGSGTFEARNIPLDAGANTIAAIAEDISGNTGTATITVTGSATPVDPVQLTVTPIAGFVPLSTTFAVSANVPGTLQSVEYDFDGNGKLDAGVDQTETMLNTISHSYASAGQYFPVVTIVTSAGRFSSVGGWNVGGALRVNVQQPPTQDGVISISDPVDLKVGGPASHLFVLSRSGEVVKEYDSSEVIVHSPLTLPSSSVPTGLDLDSAGNIYVALSGHHQVAKYKLSGSSYVLDATFNSGGPTPGKIGNDDHTSGTGDGEFNAPYDVAVSPDGMQIAVSDSANHRIQLFKTTDGSFVGRFGAQGSGDGQFNTPKGLTYDPSGYLYIVDSGNSRIALALSSSVIGTSGSSGTTLGQFSGVINLCIGSRGIYVGETGNNRVQAFDPIKTGHGDAPTPFDVRLALSSGLGLNQPSAVAPIADFLTEKIYIADTGNNRVLKVSLPETTTPDAAWNAMMISLSNGNIDQAITQFSEFSAEDYRTSFFMIGSSGIASVVSDIGGLTLTPEVIDGDSAQYTFERVIGGQTVTFPVEFVKENGIWKILEF